MKLMIISDIHGIKTNIDKVKNYFYNNNFDKLIILGDLLYAGYGKTPKEYDPKYVGEILNSMAKDIICMRGNCDSAIDIKMSKFSIVNDYSLILDNGTKIFISHGDIYNINNLPNMYPGDILLHGHTHLYGIDKVDNIYIMNPGSISLPRGGNEPTFIEYENNTFRIKNFNYEIIKEVTI